MSVFNASAASAKNVEEKLVTHVIEHLCDQGSTERSAHQHGSQHPEFSSFNRLWCVPLLLLYSSIPISRVSTSVPYPIANQPTSMLTPVLAVLAPPLDAFPVQSCSSSVLH